MAHPIRTCSDRTSGGRAERQGWACGFVLPDAPQRGSKKSFVTYFIVRFLYMSVCLGICLIQDDHMQVLLFLY